MKSANEMPATVDEYINGFEGDLRLKLMQMRDAIREAAPQAEECIAYKMPAYRQNGVLVYFAGYENHIGFYPTPSGIAMYEKMELPYKFSKGTIQFPLQDALPLDLVKEITRLRLDENMAKSKAGLKKR